MTAVFWILFIISCAFFPCQGQITSPPDGSNITVLPGENVNIKWSFNDDVSQVAFRVWFFTSSDGSFVGERLARIIDDENPQILNSGLSGISIVKPATLLLKNVNQTHDGTYQFQLSGPVGGRSEVVVFIAITSKISVNCSSVTTVNQRDYFACECKGTDGNPPADVTWYKDSTPIITGKEKAILSFPNVKKDGSGTYRCEAKSGIEQAKNETEIELIVNLTPIISVNCSSVTTVNESDYFACECKGRDGNPPADVTWYKNNRNVSVTGKEEAILRFTDVDKDNNGTYRCEAKSHEEGKNETFMELIVNYPPENVRLMLARSGQSASLTCTAEARPESTFKIFFNCDKLVQTDPTYTIPEVNKSHVGVYKCVAENILGQISTASKYFSLTTSLPTATVPPSTSQTTTNDKSLDNKSSSDDTTVTTSGTEWYIIFVTLLSGIIIGVFLCYIAWCSHRRWFRNRKPKRNPDQQPTEADSTYQGLDLSKMNKEDNYQSLRGNVARINDVTNDDDSTYTELSKTRDVEENYQSLT